VHVIAGHLCRELADDIAEEVDESTLALDFAGEVGGGRERGWGRVIPESQQEPDALGGEQGRELVVPDVERMWVVKSLKE
jgi:hypothetical protein